MFVIYRGRSYFTDFTFAKGFFYICTILYVLSTGFVVMVQPFITLPCPAMEEEAAEEVKYENVMYKHDPCRTMRFQQLLYLTTEECDFGRRLLFSVVFGGIIGWERRQADRPAGIRTMALVSLGSCIFTICSAFAFESGPMAWDASRVAAAIPSGVGFLGAGLIFKDQSKDRVTGETTHSVHGLTTAASVWLSAAVGIAAGGERYFVATFSVAIILLMLRFGPRSESQDDEEDDSEEEIDFVTELERDPEMQPIMKNNAGVTYTTEVRSPLRRENSMKNKKFMAQQRQRRKTLGD